MCGTCGDMGTRDGCLECHKKFKEKKVQIVPVEDLENPWTSATFWAKNPECRGLDLYERFIKQLEYMLKILDSGENLDRSVYISGPAHISKETFLLTLLHKASSIGLKTLPILDLDEYRRLQLVATSQSPFYKVHGVSYDNFMEADLAALTVPVAIDTRTIAAYIADIFRKRGLRNKPTVITSRFTIGQLNSYDNRKSLTDFLSPERKGNPFKLPAIITCI